MLLKPLRMLVNALAGNDTPGQYAAGFALGAWLGLMPKGNLLAQLLLVIICLFKVNTAAALAAAFVLSWAGGVVDPVSHAVGKALLNTTALTPLWTSLYNLPVVPWTQFNNTVVLGSFLVGLALLWPVYALTRPVFSRYQPRVAGFLKRFRVTKLLLWAEVTERFK